MKNLLALATLAVAFFACQTPKEEIAEVATPENMFFNTFNEPIDFAALKAEEVTEAADAIMKISDASLAKIYAIADDDRTFDNTMLALDDAYDKFGNVSSSIYLVAYTNTDSLARANALEANTTLQQYINKVQLDEKLYNAVKSYSESDDAKSLNPVKAKFVKETVEGFERNGFALSKEDRDKLKVINDELSEISNEFSQNIASHQDHLNVDAADIAGLPEDFKEARKQDDGTYKVDLSYPSYRPFMKYSKSDEARKALYMKYNNRAADSNIEVLQNLLKKRKEMANLLGHDTYAAYNLQNRMAKNPENVWAFETDLTEKVRAKATADYEEVLDVKKSMLSNERPTKLNSWETSYYNDILLREKYQLDAEEVKQYFALDDVISGLFSITQNIFDLEYKEVENPSVWHDEVRMFEVYKEGKLKGRFYLDLHPRANKYGHAACFPMITGKNTDNGYQVPTATLVCNFSAPTADKPALMPHSQVNTFFHEFGHVLHHLMTTSELSSQAGFSVAQDFVEAPSQIFENWAWDYDALKLFAKHYETDEVLPKALFDKMLAAKNVGSGWGAAGQIFYGTLDMTLHDKYDPNGEKTTTEVVEELQNELLPTSYVPDTHMQAAFGHLNGYGASYYGYLWSKVYAQDMFSEFEKNGILDKETGKRYRDIILAKGSTEKEIDLVKEFLGREPNNEAFLKSLGL